MKRKLPGRPKIKDPNKSFTVSLRLSEKLKLVKEYGSLSKAVKTLL